MGVSGWVARIGPYRVERHELPRPSGQPYLSLDHPRAFVIHTTEGSTVAGALATLGSRYSGPHFVIGEDRIVQTRPLDVQAATLRSNPGRGWWPNAIGWQVECVGRASLELHRLTPPTWGPLVALTRFMHEQCGVPLRRPDGWSDQLPRGTWANDNPRRQSNVAKTFHGLLGHIDIPDQDPTWHWDPGSLDYTALIAQATTEPTPPEEDVPLTNAQENNLEWIDGFRGYFQGQPEPADKGPAKAGWNQAQKLVASHAVDVTIDIPSQTIQGTVTG